MGTVGLKMLALKATDSSKQMVRSMNEHSWRVFMSTNDKGNSTLELRDGKIDEEGSRDDSLQVENSTPNTSTTFIAKTNQNISETPSKYSPCLFMIIDRIITLLFCANYGS